MPTLPTRLFPVAKIVFDALKKSGGKGIIFGGAAAAMNGSDVDINVTAFPEFDSSDMSVLARSGSHNMMKVTYMHPSEAVKCDVAIKRADLFPLFLRHSIHDEKHGITCAGPALLLADKIHTFADREGSNDKKRASDLLDIIFCIEKLFDNEEKMPNELKSLYSVYDWNKVLAGIAEDKTNGAHWIELAQYLKIGHTD